MSLEHFANAPIPSSPSTPWTTLSAGVDAITTTLPIVAFAAFPSAVQFRILVDDEWMLVTAGAGTTSYTVTRGIEGSTAAVHASGASVFHVLTAGGLARHPRSMTIAGDTEYLAAAGVPTRLAAPSDGDYLTRWTSAVPSWASIAAAGLLTVAAAAATYQPLGSYATLTGLETLTNKTLTTPTIASFTNAAHTHLNAAGGGTLTAAAISDLATAAIVFSNKTGNISQWTNDTGYLTSVGAYLPLAGGTLTGHLLFTDNTYDIGANSATRPRTGYFGTSVLSPLIEISATLGVEQVTLDGSFGTGTGWSFGSGKWTHGAGFTALTSTWTPTIGATYKITITSTDWSGPAGGITVSVGGQRVGAIADNVTSQVYYATALTTAAIIITPTPDTYGTTYNGAVSALSVKAVTGGTVTTPILAATNINLGTGQILFSDSFIHEYFYGYGAGVGSTGSYSNGFGYNALLNNTGIQSNAFGLNALSGNTGLQTTGIGSHALQNNIGTHSNGVGLYVLFANAGNYCSAVGDYAGYNNTKNNLTAVGADAGRNNTGANVSVYGVGAGNGNTADDLTAIGFNAAISNTGVNGVTAVGSEAASANTGQDVTAVGYKALYNNTGYRSTAVGYFALLSNTANYNTAFGWNALAGGPNTGPNNTAIGTRALSGNTSGPGSVALGYFAGAYSTTEGNEFFVDNRNRGTRAGDIANALLYGMFAASAADQRLTINGNVGIGTAPTAVLHLKAGTAATNTGPLKFTSGTLLTTAEAGAIEFLTDTFYGTITTGAVRKTFAFVEQLASYVVGPASATDNAIARFDGTTGKLIQGYTSGDPTISDTGAVTAPSFIAGTAVGAYGNRFTSDASYSYVGMGSAGLAILTSAGSGKFTIEPTGDATIARNLAMTAGGITFGTNNTNDLGASGARLRTGYFGTSVSIGTVEPTAALHLKAGTATASTAPLKFTSGTNLTTAEAGVVEYNGTNLFFTPGATRQTVCVFTQGASVADASGGAVVDAEARTALNALISRIEAIGLIATV